MALSIFDPLTWANMGYPVEEKDVKFKVRREIPYFMYPLMRKNLQLPKACEFMKEKDAQTKYENVLWSEGFFHDCGFLHMIVVNGFQISTTPTYKLIQIAMKDIQIAMKEIH